MASNRDELPRVNLETYGNACLYDDNPSEGQRSFKELASDLQAQLETLTEENENYRQEVYELRRKLEASVAMQAELTQVNELLEESIAQQNASLQRKVQDIEEKYTVERKKYEERLMEMEVKLVHKATENEELQQLLEESKKERSVPGLRCFIEDIVTPLENQVESLKVLLRQKEKTHDELLAQQQQLGKTMMDLQDQYCEMEEILNVTKEELAAKDHILENAQLELINCRMELNSLKTTPTVNSCKGNSIFAEVEDRRRIMLEKMATLHNNYLKLKRSYAVKDAKIKVLQAERATMLRKWKDDVIEKIDRDTRLMDAYKTRISELERNLKDKGKKVSQSQTEAEQPSDTNFSYLQSLLFAKKREVEELQLKLEDSSIQKVLQEERKHKLEKQLTYWRYKAMSSQAELMAIKNQLETDTARKSYVDVTNTLGDVSNETELYLDSTGKPITVAEDAITLEESIDVSGVPTTANRFTGSNSPAELHNDSTIETIDSIKSKNVCYAKVSAPRLPQKLLTTEDCNIKGEASDELRVSQTFTCNDNQGAEYSVTVKKSTIETTQTKSYSAVNLQSNIICLNERKIKNSKLTSIIAEESDTTCLVDTEKVNLPVSETFTPYANELNKENCVNVGNTTTNSDTSNIVKPVLKSTLGKSCDTWKVPFQDSRKKETKNLRFTVDAIDHEVRSSINQKETQKKYPIVFISNKLKN